MFTKGKSTRGSPLNSRTHGSNRSRVLYLALLGTPAAVQGQALPPTAPTTPPAASAPRPQSPQAPPQRAVRQAQVAYTAGRLQVTADNSSLNQILSEIGRVTGMKITGGVAEERVFGSYGPGDPSAVLSALLDGTGSNMMLRFDSARRPEELVLTPRQGGATPPNPNASRYVRREDDLPPERRLGPPQQPTYPGVPPVPAQNPPTSVPPFGAGIPASASPAADTTTQQSPNGVKTPQEIYDQLMKMQQQQQKPPP